MSALQTHEGSPVLLITISPSQGHCPSGMVVIEGGGAWGSRGVLTMLRGWANRTRMRGSMGRKIVAETDSNSL